MLTMGVGRAEPPRATRGLRDRRVWAQRQTTRCWWFPSERCRGQAGGWGLCPPSPNRGYFYPHRWPQDTSVKNQRPSLISKDSLSLHAASQ